MTKPLPAAETRRRAKSRLEKRNAELERRYNVLRVAQYQARLSFQEGFAAGVTAFAKLMASRRDRPGKSLDLLRWLTAVCDGVYTLAQQVYERRRKQTRHQYQRVT